MPPGATGTHATSRRGRDMVTTLKRAFLHCICLGLSLASSQLARAGAPARDSGAAPDLIAEYRLLVGHSSERVVLIRTARRIEHRFLDRGRDEVWERQPNGQISLVQVFVKDGKLVSYTPGDLMAVESVPVWSELGSFVATDFKHLFEPAAGSERRAGVSSRKYIKSTGRTPIVVFWAEALGLPTSITRGPLHLELKSTQPCTPDLCKAASRVGVSDFDFSDLGDREQDPWVRRYARMSGPGRALGFTRALIAR
jgi:hypothetical protein